MNINAGQLPPTIGRTMIMTDEKEITKDNIISVVAQAYDDHQKNVIDEIFLMDYERGKQPILDRVKEIRPEINFNLVENRAAEIVDMHTGYCFSNPITLVQRAKVEPGKDEETKKKDNDNKGDDDKKIALLNKAFTEQAKGTKDIELARNLFICGVGYQMVLPIREKAKKRKYSPFEILVPNPLTTFVVYSNDAYRDPVLGCTYSVCKDGSIRLTAYSENLCFELERETKQATGFKLVTVKTDKIDNKGNVVFKESITTNVLGMIPIIEFSLNDRMGVFEKAIPILDAINLIDSDRINDIMQHVQSLLWMHNCGIDTEQKKKLVDGDGVIMTKSSGDGHEAKITYLNQTLDEAQVQTLVEHLTEVLEQITATPSWKEASGGSTTGAMQLSNGWQCLEISAKTVEQLFIGPELRMIEIAIEIIKADKRPYDGLKDIEISDIEVRFCRTKTYDLVSKTNALVSLINAGVDGLTAFNTVGLFTDSQQAWLDSKKIIDGIQKKLTATEEKKEDKPNDSGNVILNANAFTDKDGKGGADNGKKDKTEESLQPSKVAGVTE